MDFSLGWLSSCLDASSVPSLEEKTLQPTFKEYLTWNKYGCWQEQWHWKKHYCAKHYPHRCTCFHTHGTLLTISHGFSYRYLVNGKLFRIVGDGFEPEFGKKDTILQ
jgi:hypothetical protein